MNPNLTLIRHERSEKDYPGLDLDDDEYVEMVFTRSRNSLLLSLGSIAALTVLLLVCFLFLLISELFDGDASIGFVLILLAILVGVDFIAVTIVMKVERGNKLFLTNKRLIQIIVNMPIFESKRSVNLGGIGHVDYDQNTLIERVLHFGTLKFSTHEKNVMILENEAPKPAVSLFKDDSGNVFAFPKVAVTHQQLEQINDLIDNAPKVSHKFSENITELDRDNL